MKPNTVAEITINYKPMQKFSESVKVVTSQDAADFARKIWSDKMEFVEEFYILILSRANRILGYSLISTGSYCGTVVSTRYIFQVALKANASSILAFHNHPSGNLNPSSDDIKLTRQLREAGQLLEIPLVDHLILTAEGHYSFADDGAL